MDQPNQWLPEPEAEELAYMYEPEDHLGMQQQFTEPPPAEQKHYYTSTLNNPFLPLQSAHFQSFGSSASSSVPFGEVAIKNEHGQLPPSPNILSFGGQNNTLRFSGGTWQGDIEGVQVAERRSRAPGTAQEHVIAERRRREKLQEQFMALATIVPALKKTDKISLLGSTIEYVKQLEERVKALEEQGTKRATESTVFESKCSISTDHNGSSDPGAGRPTVEVSIRGNTVLLKISCKERRGLLVMILSELENQGLSIINTNVIPFTDSANITVTAKIEEGFSTAVELVNNLNMALGSFNEK